MSIPLMNSQTGSAGPAPGADRIRLGGMFAAYHKTVWRLLRRRGLSHDAAADATQETFLVAAGRLQDIPPEKERAFLEGTALRMAHTLVRKNFRLHLSDNMDHVPSGARGVGDKGADLQLCDLALSKVQPELVEVFMLYEMEGFSAAEIADILDIPPGSVASRLRRAREQFHEAASRIEKRMEREGRA